MFWPYIIGALIGSAMFGACIGVLVAALCAAAKEGERVWAPRDS